MKKIKTLFLQRKEFADRVRSPIEKQTLCKAVRCGLFNQKHCMVLIPSVQNFVSVNAAWPSGSAYLIMLAIYIWYTFTGGWRFEYEFAVEPIFTFIFCWLQIRIKNSFL